MADYVPQSQREFALIHLSYLPPIPPEHVGPDPTTTRPTRPDMPDGLTGTALDQVTAWLLTPQTAADDAAVTEVDAIAKIAEFKIFFPADRAWLMTKEAYRIATWHGLYVDALLGAHNDEVVPPSQTDDGQPVNPPVSPVDRQPV